MSKGFVNSKFNRVPGDDAFDRKKDEIKQKERDTKPTNSEIEAITLKEVILLADGGGGVLLGICADPKLKTDKKNEIITLLDDGVPVAEIDRNQLIEACQKKVQLDKAEGITYLVPLYDHAVMLDYRFLNRIDAIGNIKGLNFYFKK